MHRVGVAGIQPGIGHAYRYARAVEPKLLCDGGRGDVAIVAADQLRGGFIHQLPFGGALDPEHRA